MGQCDVEQVFLLSECIVGNDRGVTFGQVYAYQVGHIIAYQCEVRFVHFALYRKEVDIFGLYAGANQFAGKAAHRSYLYSGSHRFAFYESKCLPPFAAAIRVAAAQRDEYGCHAVGQGFGQQVRGSFFAYTANLQIGTSLECTVFDVLGLIGQDDLRQRCLSDKSTVAKLLAKGVGRNAIGRIDIEAVGMRTVLSGIHADRRIGYIQYLQFLELIPQMAEINRVQFALQDKVRNLIRLIFGQHFHQSAGLGNGIALGSLGRGVQYHHAQSGGR